MRVSLVNRFHSVALLAALTAACADDKPQQLPTAPLGVASDAVSAFIAVSNPSPVVGTRVTIWVRAQRGSAVGPIGSFTIRLAYDSTRLRFVEAARSPAGMVMTNSAKAGLLMAAGAAAEGFGDDLLLNTTFDVTGSDALKTLKLNVTELNTVGFEDQKSHTSVARGLYRGSK